MDYMYLILVIFVGIPLIFMMVQFHQWTTLARVTTRRPGCFIGGAYINADGKVRRSYGGW